MVSYLDGVCLPIQSVERATQCQQAKLIRRYSRPHDLLLAHLNGDVASLNHLMAEDYAQISSTGSIVSKAEYIASIASGARQ